MKGGGGENKRERERNQQAEYSDDKDGKESA
jgi:hypothetical protein